MSASPVPSRELVPEITFDPIENRSTHKQSGLSVRWLRNEPPKELQAHFELLFAEVATPFAADYDYDHRARKAAFPDLDEVELWRATRDWPMRMNYTTYDHGFPTTIAFDHTLFLEVWHHLLSQLRLGSAITVTLRQCQGAEPCVEWKYPHE